MKTCEEFKKRLIDYIEQQLTEHDYKRYYEHLRDCRRCQKEYGAVRQLYKILVADEIVLPEKAFFDDLRFHVQGEKMGFRPSILRNIVRIVVPLLAAVTILLILNRPEKTVEIVVPTSALIADEDVASLSLSGVIDEELIQEMAVVESYLPFDINETIDGLTSEEHAALLEQLSMKYGNGY